MPLSDHEQRMLDQIESALYAEDPKFASNVRGVGFRAPSARRRLRGVVSFVIGLAMLVCGVAFKATMVAGFPVLSVAGFIVMFVGVLYAVTGPRLSGVPGAGGFRARVGSPAPHQGWRRLLHQPDGGSVPPPFRQLAGT